jgi:flagellar biosynthesis protein FliQ
VTGDVVTIVREGALLALLLAAPFLVAALIAGIVSSLVGMVTQVQDPAVGMVPRVAAVGIALVLFASPIARQLESFAGKVWPSVVAVGAGTPPASPPSARP